MHKNKKVPVIINCDTDIDDAVAILLAEKSKQLDIKLTLINDVESLDKTDLKTGIFEVLNLVSSNEILVETKSVKNTEYISEEQQSKFSKIKVLQKTAIDTIYDVLKNSEQKITIINLCPFTNIANLLKEHSDCEEKIERVIAMAGSLSTGEENCELYEFNLATDIESFNYLLEKNIEIIIIPKNVGNNAYIDWEDVFKTKNLNYIGERLELIYRSYKSKEIKHGIALNDCMPVAYLINPKIFKTQRANINIAQRNYVNFLNCNFINVEKSNIFVCTEIERQKFKKLYFKTIKRCK